jgi:hypothetical protein
MCGSRRVDLVYLGFWNANFGFSNTPVLKLAAEKFHRKAPGKTGSTQSLINEVNKPLAQRVAC